jgi:hypothetical protein
VDGGVYGLLGLIRTHRGAVEYDLRHRFHLGLRDIGRTVSIFEVARLVQIIRQDPSSMIAASVDGWDYPMSRAEAILADQYDLSYAKTGAKGRKPYPRPFKVGGTAEKHGDAGGMTRADVIARMRALGHNIA